LLRNHCDKRRGEGRASEAGEEEGEELRTAKDDAIGANCGKRLTTKRCERKDRVDEESILGKPFAHECGNKSKVVTGNKTYVAELEEFNDFEKEIKGREKD
jgi:hypothetical protein